ncbi:MAG: hypothetical protein ACREMB_03595 [Candidatus Rokuibacteriota bacterium]
MIGRYLLLVLAAAAGPGVPSVAAAQDESAVRRDLAAVIALNGLPCGEVTGLERRAENDYFVTCRDGNRYRVFVDARGRVVVARR